MNNVNLQDLVGGALQEKFSASFQKVLENMYDVNTPSKDKRSITIKLTFQQNENRDDIKALIQVTEKLAPQNSLDTSFCYGKDITTGELQVHEYGKQIKGQMSLNDVIQDMQKVSTETGEVVEDDSNVVVDLRKRV